MAYFVQDFLPWYNNVTYILLGDVQKDLELSNRQVFVKDCSARYECSEDKVLRMKVPLMVLFFTLAYVLGAVLLPMGTFKIPAYPTDKAFFWFSAVSLILNFYYFATAFLIVQSHNWILTSLNSLFVYALGEQKGILVARFFCWYWVLSLVLRYFNEAFRIFSLEHDNVRTMQIFYHMLNGLIIPWTHMMMTSPSALVRTLSYMHWWFDFAIRNYFTFEPQIAKMFRANQSNIQFYIVLLEISMHAFVLYELQESLAQCDSIMKLWVLSYCGVCMAILSYILVTGIDKKDTDPRILSGIRLSLRHF